MFGTDIGSNIGHNVQALWAQFDSSAAPEFIQTRQGFHVSILSLCSFSGRMLSGRFIILCGLL